MRGERRFIYIRFRQYRRHPPAVDSAWSARSSHPRAPREEPLLPPSKLTHRRRSLSRASAMGQLVYFGCGRCWQRDVVRCVYRGRLSGGLCLSDLQSAVIFLLSRALGFPRFPRLVFCFLRYTGAEIETRDKSREPANPGVIPRSQISRKGWCSVWARIANLGNRDRT